MVNSFFAKVRADVAGLLLGQHLRQRQQFAEHFLDASSVNTIGCRAFAVGMGKNGGGGCPNSARVLRQRTGPALDGIETGSWRQDFGKVWRYWLNGRTWKWPAHGAWACAGRGDARDIGHPPLPPRRTDGYRRKARGSGGDVVRERPGGEHPGAHRLAPLSLRRIPSTMALPVVHSSRRVAVCGSHEPCLPALLAPLLPVPTRGAISAGATSSRAHLGSPSGKRGRECDQTPLDALENVQHTAG